MSAEIFFRLKERDLRREGIVIAEGKFLAERMISSGWEILGVLCSERMASHFGALAPDRLPLLVRSDSEIEAMAGFPFHRGVLAACRRPALRSLGECVYQFPEVKRIVICPDISNGENLGSIMRSAAAFGYGIITFGNKCCDPLSRKSLKASMGAPFNLHLAEIQNEREEIDFLKRRGYSIYGTMADPDAEPITSFSAAKQHALVFGNEAEGLSETWRGFCDRKLTIPLESHTDSLNVGVAAGIFMFHLGRTGN